MKETIIRNREALGLIVNDMVIDGLMTINNLLSVESIVLYNKQGCEYILADGLIIAVDR